MRMAEQYRDYGYFMGMNKPANTPIDAKTRHGQVFYAVHDGGDKLLPHLYRSFIDFSYGGRSIHDFDLIATLESDMMNRALSAEFNDLTSDYDVLDGQFYHGTHYKTNSLSLHLSTDGMDQQKLEEFRQWFRGGVTRELILDEHPNRAIMARVATAPQIEMLPFEKSITLTIAGHDYVTSTTEYRGTILLEFIMDEPYWYSKINLFGSRDKNTNEYNNTWYDPDVKQDVAFFSAENQGALKDVLKIVYEDGIPINDMIVSPMLFGGDLYASEGEQIIGKVAAKIDAQTYGEHADEPGYHHVIADGDYTWLNYGVPDSTDINSGQTEGYFCGAVIASADGGAIAHPNWVHVYDFGRVSGAFVASSDTAQLTLSHGVDQAINLYYAGTAPSPTVLSFKLPIITNDNGYINSIASQYATLENGHAYNTITLESEYQKQLHLTTPNFLTSYNKVLGMLYSGVYGTGAKTWGDLRADIRDIIRHPVIRAIAIQLINQQDPNGINIIVNNAALDPVINALKTMFSRSSNIAYMSVILNAKTGETYGDFTFYNPVTEKTDEIKEENVGDMLDSNHLYIEERNYYNSQYQVEAWNVNNKKASHRLYHDFTQPLQDLKIEYKYLYY